MSSILAYRGIPIGDLRSEVTQTSSSLIYIQPDFHCSTAEKATAHVSFCGLHGADDCVQQTIVYYNIYYTDIQYLSDKCDIH